MVRKLAAVTTFNPDHTILIDQNKTKVAFTDMEDVMKITLEFIQCMPPAFINKVANVIPNDANRALLAKKSDYVYV